MKGGGLKIHNIRHLSPSSLNSFATQPSAWLLERLLKRNAPVGCAAHRGTAAEAGIVHGLQDFTRQLGECQDEGLRVFDRLTALSGDSRRTKEREAVPGIIATGLAELRQYGPPSRYQGKVVHEIDDLSCPILGFFDFAWDDHGIVVDLKTQLRLSGEISAGHARQVALYVHRTNAQGRVAYVTPHKVGVYVVENSAEHMAALVNIAHRLDRFLALSADPLELASLLVPDLDHWIYSDPLAQANARELYGFTPSASAAAPGPTALQASA